MSTQISIDRVWPPKKTNGKYGTVKLTSGDRWFIPIAMLNQVRSGMMAVVETEQQNWSDGAVTIIKSVMENPHSPGVSSYDPSAKDKTIWIQGIVQAALHGRSWANEMELRAAVFEACEVAKDAHDTFIAKSAPKPVETKPAEQTNYRESGQPYAGKQAYSTNPQDDPRFSAPPPSPGDYGAGPR